MTIKLGEVVGYEYVFAKAKELFDLEYRLNPVEVRPQFESQPPETRAHWFARAANRPVADSGFEAVCARAMELYEQSPEANPPAGGWKSLTLESQVKWLNEAERRMVADQKNSPRERATVAIVKLDEVATDDYIFAKAKELFNIEYRLNPVELRPRFESLPLDKRVQWFARVANRPVADSGFEAVCARAMELYEQSCDANLPGRSWKLVSLESRAEWLNKAEREIAADRESTHEPPENTTEDPDEAAGEADELTP